MILSLWIPVLVIAGIACARAQEPLWFLDGEESNALGVSVAGGWDVNGDGIDDIVIGASFKDARRGEVRVVSGSNGDLIHVLSGSAADDVFGESVALCGDLDGDGCSEFLVGARTHDWFAQDTGSAYLYSGKSALPLFAWHGEAPGVQLGGRVSGLGDVDGDGYRDIGIAVLGDDHHGEDTGAVYVYSGRTYWPIRWLYGDSTQCQFGRALAECGDVDADGRADILIGAPTDSQTGDRTGMALVISGADSTVLYEFHGVSTIEQVGSGGCSVGDLDSDGHDDFLVGAAGNSSNGNKTGRVTLHSGADGTIMHEYFGKNLGDKLGSSMSSAGDCNGDGMPDFLLASNKDSRGSSSGTVWIYSGLTGQLCYRLEGESDLDAFGDGLSTVGDVDGDGLSDFAVGAPFDDDGGNASGRVTVFSGSELFLQIDPDRPRNGETLLVRATEGLPASVAALFLVELEQNPIFLLVSIQMLDANGQYVLDAVVPPGLSGLETRFQCFAQKTGADARGLLESGKELVEFR